MLYLDFTGADSEDIELCDNQVTVAQCFELNLKHKFCDNKY